MNTRDTSMKIAALAIGLISVWIARAGAAVDAKGEPPPWQPANPRLLTRWAQDVSPENVLPEYPRPQMVRPDWLNLNGLWQIEEAHGASEPPPIGRELRERILVPFPVESALSGIGRHAERWWYRRTFTVPEGWIRDDRHIILHFGAVDWETRIWIDGSEYSDAHRGGYDSFSFDITNLLAEDRTEHELIVGVFDPTDAGTQPRGKQVAKPEGIWYTPTTGIWQTVWLEPVPDPYISRLRLTPVLNEDPSIMVQVSFSGGNDIHNPRDLYSYAVVAKIWDEGRLVSVGGGSLAKPFEVSLGERPRLWSTYLPLLYDVEITVERDGKVLDRVTSYFGLREIAVRPDDAGIPRIHLNGKPIFLIGPLDQGFWPDGLYTAPTDAALRFDIEQMKKLGFNAVRKHVKVEPERWYYWADRLGLLVLQDMPSGDAYVEPGKGEIMRTPESVTQFNIEWQRMIAGRGNHPSIIAWVIFNEGWGQFETDRITSFVREFDSTRLIDSASGWNDMGVGDFHDIHVYPGPGAPPIGRTRAAVLGEFGGLGLRIDGHSWAPESWGYHPVADRDELTDGYVRLVTRVWDLARHHGLTAAIYTQLTDVESECNGLLTYDRAVLKVDLARVAGANRGEVPTIETVVATAVDRDDIAWRYTLSEPGDGDAWTENTFDDSSWAVGSSGFGSEGTPGGVVRTPWTSPDIWLRREVTLPAEKHLVAGSPISKLRLWVHHDEDAEIYINGVLAAKLTGYTTSYEDVAIAPEVRAALRPLGQANTLAVHCRQTTGGQYIDVGFITITYPNNR